MRVVDRQSRSNRVEFTGSYEAVQGFADLFRGIYAADLDLNEGVNACKIGAAARERGFENALEGVDCKDFEKKN
jgi:hypothetical protein